MKGRASCNDEPVTDACMGTCRTPLPRLTPAGSLGGLFPVSQGPSRSMWMRMGTWDSLSLPISPSGCTSMRLLVHSALWQDLFAAWIVPYLTAKDVGEVCCVCRSMYFAAEQPQTWRALIEHASWMMGDAVIEGITGLLTPALLEGRDACTVASTADPPLDLTHPYHAVAVVYGESSSPGVQASSDGEGADADVRLDRRVDLLAITPFHYCRTVSQEQIPFDTTPPARRLWDTEENATLQEEGTAEHGEGSLIFPSSHPDAEARWCVSQGDVSSLCPSPADRRSEKAHDHLVDVVRRSDPCVRVLYREMVEDLPLESDIPAPVGVLRDWGGALESSVGKETALFPRISFSLSQPPQEVLDGGICNAPGGRCGMAPANDGRSEELLICAATARRTLCRPLLRLPWRRTFQWLYAHRVSGFLMRQRPLVCAAEVAMLANEWSAARASLTVVIHAILQGGCATVEHAMYLRKVCVLRADTYLQPDVPAALQDLCFAELLRPSVSLQKRIDLGFCRHAQLASTPSFSLGHWFECYDEAAQSPEPHVRALVLRSLVSFPRGWDDGVAFVVYVTQFLLVAEQHYYPLHLLQKATAFARTSVERLIVQVLRALYVDPPHRRLDAIALAELAVSLLPAAVRDGAAHEAEVWCLDSIVTTSVSVPEMVRRLRFRREVLYHCELTPVAVQTYVLPSLVYYLLGLATHDITSSGDAFASYLSLGLSARHQAVALTCMAVGYAGDAGGAEAASEETLCFRDDSASACLCRRLLGAALELDAFYVPAYVALARLYMRMGELLLAHRLLTDGIHRYAVLVQDTVAVALPFCRKPVSLARHGGPLRRPDRGPDTCFIPADLLVERSRCLVSDPLIDLNEATTHNPRAPHPYRVRSAMLMDAHRPLEALEEMQHLLDLSLQPADITLCLRFLLDEMERQATPPTPLLVKAAQLAGALRAIQPHSMGELYHSVLQQFDRVSNHGVSGDTVLCARALISLL